MNENKTTKTNSKSNGKSASSGIRSRLAPLRVALIKGIKWLRKEIALVIGAIIILIITLTVTQATPISRWMAAPSNNCLTQGYGNTMVENNGIVYVLFGTGYPFRSFDPTTGDCSPTALANFPDSSVAQKLIVIDADTLYATSDNSSYYYHIRDNFWSFYPRSKADNSDLPEPIDHPYYSQGYGNTIVAYNNELYVLAGGNNYFEKYTPSTNTWITRSGITGSPGSGGAFVYPGSGVYLYALRGNNYNNLYRYDTGANSWATMANAPGTVNAGGAMTAVNGTDLYAFGGNNTTRFWKYNIAGNTWTDLVDYYAPDRVYGGASMTSIGSKIYALQGNLSRSFWEFDTSLGTPAWVEKADLPERASSGAALTTDGTYIYATSGKNSGNLFRYDPTLDSWTQLKTGHAGTSNDVAGYGLTTSTGGMTYVAVGPSGGPEIYFTTGYGATSSCTSSCRDAIVRYVISSDTWPAYQSPPTHPTNISYGASAAYPSGGDNIFVLMGTNTNNFWKFLMSQNIYLPVAISKFNATDVIATAIPGLTGYQSTGSSITRAGNKLYLALSSTYFVEYDPLTNNWKQLPKPPISISTGGALTAYDDDTLFLSTGSNFYKYDIPHSTWFNVNIGKTATGEPIAQIMDESEQYSTDLDQEYGSHIIDNNGELFVFQGYGGTRFNSYNPTTNRWTSLTNVPSGVSNGGNSVAVDQYIFTLRAGNYNTFYRYDTTENTWTTMAVASLNVHYGGSSAYPGGDFIYALPGNRTNGFMRYCYQNTGSGCTANTWTNLTSTIPSPHTIHTGAGMTALNSTTLYATAGNYTNFFMRFDITDSPAPGDGVWTDLSSIDPLPDSIASGASLTSDGTYLYASRGQNTPTIWRYDPAGIAGSRWTTLQNAPANIGYSTSITDNWGGITYSSALGEIYAITGYGQGGFNQVSGTAPGLIYRYQLPASNGPPADDYTWPHFAATASPPSNFSNGAALTHPIGSDYIYAFRGNATTHFWRYHVPDNEWKIIYQSKLDDDTPVSQGPLSQTQGSGNSIAEVNGVFYVINGNNTNIFQKYDPSTNTWTSLQNTPVSCGNGAAIVKADNDNLYIFAANGTNNFWRYNIPSDGWSRFNTGTLLNGDFISQAGNSQGTSSAITIGPDPATGNKVFFIASGAGNQFQKYDPATNTWTNLATLPAYTTTYGASLVTVGTDIYYRYGNSYYFYKYSITDNSWTQMANVLSNYYIRAGDNMAYPGSGDYIYVLRGYDQTTNNFLRYSISGNSWSLLTNAPNSSDAGGSVAFLNSNDLYVLRGNNFKDFWKYDVTLNSWDVLSGNQPPFVSNVQAGGSLASDGTYIYATVGNNTKEFWRYNPVAASGSRWSRFSSTAIGNTGDLPANMGLVDNDSNRGGIVFCDDCGGTGLDEIWAITGNGATGYPANDNAGLIFRFRIDPVTCDALGLNPGTGSSPCVEYDGWIHAPKSALAPATVSYGGALTYPGSGNLLYAFRGTASNTFWAYNMVTNAWSTLTVAPATISGGGALTSYINGLTGLPDIYALRGLGTNSFWLYRVTDLATGAGTWNPTDPADKPGTVAGSGASLTTDGAGNIYATGGNSQTEIYRYEIATDTWSSTSPGSASLTFPNPLFIGASSTTDARGGIAYTANGPSGGPELFAVTGNGNSGGSFTSPVIFAGLIYRYPLTTGVNVGTWPLSYTPAAQPTTGKTINYGGALVSTDSDSIFALRGGNTNEFWRYDIGDNSWNHTLPTLPTPATIGAGGALTHDGNNNIFATAGGNNKTFFQYTVDNGLYPGSGSWSALPDSPVTIQTSTTNAGGGLAYTDFSPAISGDENVWMATGYGRSLIDNSRTAQLLYRYDVDSAEWPYFAPASDPPTTSLFSAGSDLALNVDSTAIYALRGTEPATVYGSANWSSTNSNFWKYTVGTDTWTSLTNVLDNTSPKWVYSGGSITSTDVDTDIFYVSTGGSSKDILKYSIAGDSWLAPSNLAFPFSLGTQSNGTDGGGLSYSPSTQKLLGTTGTDTTAPYTIYYVDLANRAVPELLSALAATDSTFDIRVQSLDLNDNPINVTQNTTITLSLKSGTGSLGGNLSGVIPVGSNTVTISGVTYNTAEDIVITATDTSASPTLLPSDAAFTVHGPSPTITQISPNSGSTIGGTTVTITGTNFTEDTYVTFDDMGADEVVFISSTELQVITPGLNIVTVPYVVDVSAVQPNGQSATSIGGYTYLGPTISSITPDTGGTAGGTAVTITGDNFGPSIYLWELAINNTGSPLTDYPVKLSMDTTSLIMMGKMRADCGDIRIRDDDANRQLNYWVEDNTCNTSSTNIWIKVPNIPNGTKPLNITYGNKLLTSQSDGNKVFLFFDDFEQTTLDTSKWTDTTGTSPIVEDGKLRLNNSEGIYAGNYTIPASTVWETITDPRTTSRYGNALKGAGTTSVAWTNDAAVNVVSMFWSSSTLYAETLAGNTSMGAYTVGPKNYKITYRPNDTNQVLFNYNNGATTTVNNADPGDSLHPSFYVNSGNYDAQWEYVFIRPYGAATEPTVSLFGSEAGGPLQVQFDSLSGTVAAEDIEFIDNETIKAVTPQAFNDTYDVIVTNVDGRAATLSNSYTYAAPTIANIIPNIGTTAGGSDITISGTNFTEGGYRRPIFIMNKSGTTLTDQTLFFTMDTATLISRGKIQSACEDIRVKDSDHLTYLNHWVEGCNSDLTHIWVQLPSLPPEGKNIYVHYGNANYASTATPENFFPTLASSNKVLWLKSDYGVTLTSGFVSAWNDLSGNGNNVSILTATSMPAYNTTFQNGFPAISFDGSNDYLNRTGFTGLPTGNADRSAFIVARYDKVGYGGFTYGNNATLQAFGMVINSSGNLSVQGWGTDYNTTTNVTYTGILLHEAVLSGLSLMQWRNGTQIYGPTTTALNTATTKIEVGREMDGSPYVDMDLFEVIIFDKALSTSERQEIENYITLKYDLNNNIQTSTYTGLEVGIANTFDTYIGGAPVEPFTSFSYTDSNTITAITPPHAAGTVDISVVTPDAQTATALNGYTFADPPTISSINPVTGINNNSALSVSVIGTNITGLTQLKLTKTDQTDIVCSNYSNVTATTLTCDLNIQKVSVGDWNVEIYTPGIIPGTNNSLINGFSITPAPPTFTNFTPSGGSIFGGELVTITGDYFVFKGGNYTTPFSINNTGSEQTDYQVRLTLDTATPIAAGHMRSDCGDIRVYSNHDYTISLPYFLESGCNSASTVIWTKVPTITANATTTLYVNYGLTDRTSESNGDSVFLFFDDFEGATLDSNKWVVGGYANWILETADRYQGTNSSKNGDIPDYAYASSYIASKDGDNLINVPTGRSAIIDMHWKVSSQSGSDWLYYCKTDDDTTLPSCTMDSGYSNRISGTVDWTREQTTGAPLSAGLHRIKFAYEKNYYTSTGSDTGWVDAVKVRLYADTVSDGVAGTELVEQNSPITVTFGTTDSTDVTYVDSTTITAIAPPHAAGAVDITVTNPDLQFAVSPSQYTYSNPPTVTSIDPVAGITTNSALTVTIYGTDFLVTPTAKLTKTDQPDIACTNPRNFVDGSPDSFQCDLDLTTATIDGDWNVVVTNPDQQTSTLTDGFAISYAPPTISTVVPNQGPSEGGTNVTITGTSFYQETAPLAYKVPVTITNAGAEQNNFQIQLTVDTATLISNAKMNADCSDIRLFADYSLATSLPYFLESGCNTATTVIWTKVPTITATGNTIIYLAYGAPTYLSESNADNVFLFFDNFEQGLIDSNKWIVGGNVNWMIEVADSFEGIFSSKNGDILDSQSSYIATKDGVNLINIPSGSVGIIDFYWKVSSESCCDFNYYCQSDDDITLPSCTRTSGFISRIGGSVNWTRQISTTTTLAPGLHRIKFAYEKDSSVSSGSDTGWIDLVKVRLYSPDITDGVVGTEENAITLPTITFGGVPAINVVFGSATSLTANTPAGTGLVDVTVTNPDLQSDTLTNGYTFLEPPTILSITPDTGHNQESLTGVVITGTDFVDSPTVTLFIGETPIACTNVTFVNSTQITCDLNLNGAFTGLYSVRVQNPDLQSDYLVDGFEITYPQPTITAITPNTGNIAGGETITITGTYFENGADVDFNGTYSTSVTFINATELEVLTPAHTIGLKDVTVTNPNAMFVTATNGYEYTDPPIVTGIVPATGTNDLAALGVTISGSNFVAPLNGKLTRTGETDITCSNIHNFIDGATDSFECDLNIQDALTGLWNVVVTNGNGQVGSLADAFEVTYAPPTVTTILPNEVASGTTESVTVGGTNFYSEAPDFITVDIGGTGGVGGTPCTTPVLINANSLTCNLPAFTAGSYDVTVTTGAGTDTAENLITYFDAPTVTAINPDHGLTVGGESVTITGTNFYGTPTVYMTHTPMEETTCTNVIVTSSTTLTCDTPASTEGLVDVRVVTSAGTATLNDGFTYEPPPVDGDASIIEIFGYRIEPINTTYYDSENLSPVNAALIKVTAIETITGNRIIGRDVTLTATPPDDLLIHTTNCSNIYDSSIGTTIATDGYGTACFLIWSTATPSFTASFSDLSATVAGSGTSGAVTLTNTVGLEIEEMALTSILNYRFRNDDGTELTATPIAETSTPHYNAQNDLAFRLRFGLTRNISLASSFAKNDEFSPSATVDIASRPLPAASPTGLSSFRAFPAYALDNSTNTLYIATPNRADSKARIYKYNLANLTQAATYFEFPGTVNFTPATPDDIDAPIDGGTHLITKMFIDEDNQLMYFVLTPYFDDTGLTRIYKVNLTTNTVVDVFAEPAYGVNRGSLDAEIDLSNGYLYLTMGSSIIPNDSLSPVSVQKLDLQGPTEPMTMVGELLLDNSPGSISSSVIDLTNQFLYVTTGDPQKIIKIDLDVDASLPPVKVDEIALVPVTATSLHEMIGVQNAVIDPVAGYAYFASSTDFTHPDYDNTQKAFITKVDIDPTRDFEVISRLNLLPPNPANDFDYNADYAFLPPTFGDKPLYSYASIDQTNGYAFFPVARNNPVRDAVTWKLMRIHLDTFTRDSLYDEMNYADILNSTTIKGSIFRPETGRGYIVREQADGDVLTEFNSTTRQNLKLQSSPNVDPAYCNFASADLYTWSDLPNTDFVMVDSANFTDADPTTNVTGLLYDNNDYFVSGQLKDASATTDRISMGQNQLTEIEYSLKPTAAAKGSYCFRLVDADPAHQNQVSGNPNQIYNIITPEFEVANYHHFVPLTINGVILEKNEVNAIEGTTSDSYGIKLASQPTAEVVITVTAGDDRLVLSPDATPLTPTETTLTFTTTDWDTYQYIETGATDNEIIDGTTTDLIQHTVTSTDLGYNNIIVEPVTSIVTDYGATISNVLATVSGTITFTPPGDFSFPNVNSGVNTPNYSPSLTVNVEEGRGTAFDYTLTLQADDFCRAPGICIPLSDVYTATSNLINAFSTFDAAQIGQFLSNYLQVGETLDNPDTYKHVDPGQNRPLSAPITLIDSRNIPSGNSENPLQGSLDFDLNLMIDFGNIVDLTGGVYSTLLTIDLNANPL